LFDDEQRALLIYSVLLNRSVAARVAERQAAGVPTGHKSAMRKLAEILEVLVEQFASEIARSGLGRRPGRRAYLWGQLVPVRSTMVGRSSRDALAAR
jgi:hypothetical protein